MHNPIFFLVNFFYNNIEETDKMYNILHGILSWVEVSKAIVVPKSFCYLLWVYN